MQLPEYIRKTVEENAARFEHKELTRVALRMSEKYREEKGDGSRLVTRDCEAAAYAVVRMPATFAAVSSALSLSLEHFAADITTLTDIGAGTGTGLFACTEILPGIEEVLCIEREPEMQKLGEHFAEAADLPCRCEWTDPDITKADIPRRSDLVTASYILNELTPQQRVNAVRKMWDATEKLLLIIEPGTKTGYTNIVQARNLLTSLGAHIAAPCPDLSECPLPENDWCHFTTRVERTKLHKLLKGGDSPFEDEKFSFIAAVRGDSTPCERRILRHPEISSGMIGLHVCTARGIEDIKITKKSPDFKKARKSDCGDSI